MIYLRCAAFDCREIFTPRRTDMIFCSKSCGKRHRALKHRLTPVERTCDCGEVFTPKVNQKFCSKTCRSRALNARYKERHPDRVAQSKRAWELANPDAVRKASKHQYQRNRSKRQAYSLEYYRANRTKILAQKRKKLSPV